MSNWQEVLDDLVEQRQHFLVAYALMLTGERAEAEDLVQDALISTFSSRRRFAAVAPAEAYVRRAIASRFIDEKRRATRARKTVSTAAAHTAMVTRGHESAVIARTDLEEAMKALSPRERTCVALRYLEQMSTTETASALSMSDGAVKRYLSDGMAKLNEVLGTAEDPSQFETAPVIGKERNHD